jgi:uncharacterized membrane protein
MTFNLCNDCGDSVLRGMLFLVCVWLLPTILLAVKRQLGPGSRLSSSVALALWTSVAAASFVSLAFLGLVDVSHPVFRPAVLFLVVGAVVTAWGVAFYRSMRRRRRPARS